MAVQELTDKFRTSDGAKHKTKVAAERHEAMLEAAEGVNRANRILAQTTIETYKTADGHPFKFEWRDYWYPFPAYQWPYLRRVTLHGGYSQRYRVDEDGRFFVLENNGSPNEQEFDVGKLYYDEIEGKKALAKLQFDWLADRQKEHDKLVQEIAAKAK